MERRVGGIRALIHISKLVTLMLCAPLAAAAVALSAMVLLVVLAVELQKSELLVVLHCSPYQLLAARATLVARVDPIIKRQVAVAVLENPDILRLRCA